MIVPIDPADPITIELFKMRVKYINLTLKVMKRYPGGMAKNRKSQKAVREAIRQALRMKLRLVKANLWDVYEIT